MKKICLLVFVLMFSFAVTSFAAPTQSVGVVIVSGQEFRTPEFFSLFSEKLPLRFPAEKYKLLIGQDMQNKYMLYWDKKGFLSEQTPTKEDLLAFSKEIYCDYTLYLIVTAKDDGWNNAKKVRTSVDVRSILIKSEEQEVVSNLIATDQGDSKGSHLRARREALGRIMDYLIANMKF